MTRILFTCRPLAGHFEPLRPLAAVALAEGHDVAFATGEPLVATARERGFEAFAAGPPASLRDTWATRVPAPEVLATDAGRTWFFTEIFAGLELGPRAADLASVVASWRPELVVHELAELAGPLVATAAGLPYATAGYGILPPQGVLRAAAAAAAPHWEGRALSAPAYAGLFTHLYLDVCPSGLQVPWAAELPARTLMRPGHETHPPPPWLSELPHRRTVYVTFGTVWNRDPARFTTVIDALAGDPLNLVVTTGGVEVESPRPGVHVESFIPQAAILPHCDAVICHGGSGTILGALAHGRPLLVLPQGADQFDNARRIVAVGAGLSVPPGDQVREATFALLEDDRYARTAAALADEIAAMPDAGSAVRALEELAERHA